MFEVNYPNPGADMTVFHFDFPFFQTADINVEVDGELVAPDMYNLIPNPAAVNSGIPYVGGTVEFSDTAVGAVRIFRRLVLERSISYQPTEPIMAVSLNRDFNFLLNAAKELNLKLAEVRMSIESIDELGDLDIDAINDLIADIRNMGDLATEADLNILRDEMLLLAEAVQYLADRQGTGVVDVDLSGIEAAITLIENQIFEIEAAIAAIPNHTAAIQEIKSDIAEVSERVDNIQLPDIDIDELKYVLAGLETMDYVVDTWRSIDGNLWYRKYKSGWIEQGGTILSTGTTNQIVTLPRPMTSSAYQLNMSIIGRNSEIDASALWVRLSSLNGMTNTTISVRTGFANSGASGGIPLTYSWYVAGYAQ